MRLTLRYAVRSDLGLVRGNNEDSVYAGPRLLAIADGMGGHAAGEVASKIVIGTLEPLDDDRTPSDLIAAMRDAVLEANQRITDAVEQDSKLDGMGTTLTALRFSGAQVGLVHVGDSRAYLLRGDVLAQITHDDTYVQYLVDSGKLTPDEAKDHPRKSVILRALRGAEVEPDVSIREARAGDRYLLCTDGLSDVVSTETIFETLRIPDPQECADRLVELALRGGGPDNVTVIVADVIEARPGDAVDDVPVIAGALTDPSDADARGNDSPAERAAAISRPRPTPAADADPPKRRRLDWKTPVLILGILAIIAAALGGTYAWAQTQYYVGKAGNEVAIYRGVKASFGPLKFSEVDSNTGLSMDDLVPSWRSQVESGITAKSRGDARRIITRLYRERKPICRPTSSSSSAGSTATPTTTPTTTPTSTPTTTPTSGRTTGALRPTRPPVTSARLPSRSSVVRAHAPAIPTGTARVTAGAHVGTTVGGSRATGTSATTTGPSGSATSTPTGTAAGTTPSTSPFTAAPQPPGSCRQGP